jgi:hypothetical protein
MPAIKLGLCNISETKTRLLLFAIRYIMLISIHAIGLGRLNRIEEMELKITLNAYKLSKMGDNLKKQLGVAVPKEFSPIYPNMQYPMDCNILKANKKHQINDSRPLAEAFDICFAIIDGYINQCEYDLEPFYTPKNRPFVEAILQTIDPFTNQNLKDAIEHYGGDLNSNEYVKKFFKHPVVSMLLTKKSVRTWIEMSGRNGYIEYMSGVAKQKDVDRKEWTFAVIPPEMEI